MVQSHPWLDLWGGRRKPCPQEPLQGGHRSARLPAACPVTLGSHPSLGTCEAKVLLWKTSEYLLDPCPRFVGPPSLAVSAAWTAKVGDPGCLGPTPAPPLAGCAGWIQPLASLCPAALGCSMEGTRGQPKAVGVHPGSQGPCHQGPKPLCWGRPPAL